MSSNVGLSTPRGSGTSGYVQRNLSSLKPRATGYGQPYSLNDAARPPKIRKPDEDILKHDRLRDIEVKVMELRDKLEDEGKLEEDDIDIECDALRTKLIEDASKGGSDRKGGRIGGKAKNYQVHELAEAKAKESERLRRALGLKADAVSGAENGDKDANSEHPMAKQDRRKREAEADRARRDESSVKKETEDARRNRRRHDDDD